VRVDVSAYDEGVELVVEDDGSGVPAEDRTHIFDRFVRVGEARSRIDGGTGLGLAIVRSVADRHGGTVTLDGGSRFVVRLNGLGT
jgi:signal transduction histidine kinase